ncbi:FHA domain-containing protein, partial [Streptomyces aureus]|uniref:FHA domain-containing protein n=1 Tax=Streptomyces aureus TaxID=193461 RepID=UPI0020B1759F
TWVPASPPPGHRPAVAAAGRPAAPGPGTHGGAGTQVRRWIEINGTRHQISRPTLVLGRSTDADVRIDDPGVSRRHCEIRTGTPSTIQDLGSTNGIVVDGQHTTRATLRDGSRIVVGSTTIVYRQAEG